MNPVYSSILLLFVILFLIILPQKKRNEYIRRIKAKRKRKERETMAALIESYLGKECIIYTMYNEISGTPLKIDGGWLSVKVGEETQAINMDFIVRVREHPRKKNGKKKQIVAD